MKNGKKTNWLRTTLIVLILCGILGTVLSVILFKTNPDKTYAYTKIQFSFDGAAEGKAPNGVPFGISDIASDAVLNAALENAGLQDRYTPEQLRACLTAKGVYPENIAKQVMSYDSLMDFTANRILTVGDFHPTTFSIVLTDDFDPRISQTELQRLMDAVMTAYREYFAKAYSLGTDFSEYEALFDPDAYDYPQQVQILRQGMMFASEYAMELYEMDPTFRVNGTGFNDIAVRLDTMIGNDVSRINANITMNALTKDPARLLTEYQYEIRTLNHETANEKENLAKLDTLIAAYDKNEIIYLSTADSLTKIDGNSSETYDSLVDSRKDVAGIITDLNTEIATYQLKINDLMQTDKQETTAISVNSAVTDADGETVSEEAAPTMTEEEIAVAAQEAREKAAVQVATLEGSIDDLIVRRNTVIGDLVTLIQAYNEREINDGTVTVSSVKYQTPKLLSGAFVKSTLKVAGPFCAVGFIVCLILLIIDRKKSTK